MFTKSKLVVTTPPTDRSKSDGDFNYKFLYTKLFDDRLVDYYLRTLNSHYKDEDVKKLRRAAESKLSHFLNTKIKDYGDLFPFGYNFFAMLVPIAHRIGSRGSPRTMPVAPLKLDIPFAACTKFAFDHSQTGKIAALCGEVGLMPDKDSKWEERAKSIRNSAEELIKW